ncbi:MAG: DNA internalization-related competence protein ComEC/Rec2 [Deltaproteobacteria bacterium]|nr:DNA internalization-related competence protein ComEC/Rec2 [Deltaproteobacteria bacterium]
MRYDRLPVLVLVTVAALLGQAGVAWGWGCSSLPWLLGFVITLGLAFLFCPRRLALLFACGVLSFGLAGRLLEQRLSPQLPPTHLRQLPLPQDATVEGWLFREPERFPHRGRLYLEALHTWRDGVSQPATGKISLNVRTLSGPWQYGDVVRVPLRLRAPRNFRTPGSFDYEGYLARQGIYLTAFLWDDAKIERVGWQGNWLRARLEQMRRTLGHFFSSHLDAQTAAVLRALIVGDEGGVTKDLRTAFSRAGVAHVLSISGLHISLVAMASFGAWWWVLGRSRYLLLRFVMPKLAALLTMLPVLLYAGLAGGNLATWRSVTMVMVFLFAIVVDRQDEVYRSLALAALLISFLWPGAALEISFQLSFLSVLSILLGMEHFSAWWAQWRPPTLGVPPSWREQALRWGAAYVAVSAYALFGTAPLTALYFNQVSVAGLFANLLVVPLLGSGAVLLGLVTSAVFFLHAGVASWVLIGAGWVTHAGTWLTLRAGSWSWAAFDVVTPTLLELSLLYGCFLSLLFLSFPIRTRAARVSRYLLPVLLLAVAVDGLVWVQDRYFRQELRVSFLDVGQGDAAVVELPGSQVMVIDGGGFASEEFDSGEAILAPFLWSRKIGRVDIVAMSHPQLDHYGGLAFVVERFAPREFWFNGEQSSAQRFARLWTALEHQGVQRRRLCRDAPDIALPGVVVQVLHPPCQPTGLDTNNASLVLRLSHGAVDVVFSGDIEAEGERELVAAHAAIASEILKAPHHGSRTSSTLEFVGAVAPQLVVASLGHLNRFGFPAAEVVRRYEDQGSRVLRTDVEGTVAIVSDGHTYRVEGMGAR